MYCSNCGKEVPEGAAYCPECGHKLIQIPNSDTQYSYNQENNNQINDQQGIDGFFEDRGNYWKAEYNQPQSSRQVDNSLGIGWLILACLSPLVALIIGLVFWRKRPRTAKWCLIIAAVGYLINWYVVYKVGIDNLLQIAIQLIR